MNPSPGQSSANCRDPRGRGSESFRRVSATGHVSLPNLPLTSLQQCGSNPHGRIEGPSAGGSGGRCGKQPSRTTQIATHLFTGTDSSNPKEASSMFWSVLGAVLLLVLAA